MGILLGCPFHCLTVSQSFISEDWDWKETIKRIVNECSDDKYD
jgi:hypothetical protein